MSKTVDWTACERLKRLTTETRGYGVFLNFSQCLGDSVVRKEVKNHFRLLMPEVYCPSAEKQLWRSFHAKNETNKG
jgi:hypothetical protein